MDPTTAQPVGAQLLAQTAQPMGQWSNQLVSEAATQPQQVSINPNDIYTQSDNYAQLVDAMNKNLNYANNPQIANAKQAVTNNMIQQYNSQMSPAFAQQATQQIGNDAARAALGNVYGSGVNTNSSIGQANVQQAIGQGALGANQYVTGVQNAANQNAANLVNSQYQTYAPSGSQMENFTLGQQAQQVSNNNAWTQNLENAQGAQYNTFQGNVNNAANSAQAVANQNAAASNQAAAANLSFYGGLANDAFSAAKIAAV